MDIEILSQKFCDYSVSIRGYSKNTVKRYRNVIRGYSQFTGVNEISKVTDDNVRTLFYYGRTERKWSVNTFIVYHKTLLVFFRWCMKQGYMEKNPILDIEIPKMEKRLPIKLTKQVSLKLLEVVYNYPYEYKFLRYRNHAIFSTFIFTGLRKQELLNLKFTDIDIDNLTIFVSQGKGNKDRVVPISYTLAQSLKKYKDERKRLNKTNPEFFSSLRGNVGFTENGLKKLVEQVRKSSGVVFSVHKLRHTFATLMLEGGCDIYSLSKMMGHSDIKTTTIYLSASAEHLRSQMTKHPLKGFYDHLDSSILKKTWKDNFNLKDLPKDHYAVFKSITQYSYVRAREIRKLKKSAEESKTKFVLGSDTLKWLRENSKIKQKKNAGIPQGTPISCALSNLYMLDFDKVVSQRVSDLKGLYRRYSDDILIVCPDKNSLKELEIFIKNKIQALKLEIQDAKTERLFFSHNGNIIECKNEENKPSYLQYLGVIFDGKDNSLRHKGYAKFERKMKSAIVRKIIQAQKLKTPFFKRKIYEGYSSLGKQNYVKYAERASEKLSSSVIKKQINPSKIMKKINKKINKEKSKL